MYSAKQNIVHVGESNFINIYKIPMNSNNQISFSNTSCFPWKSKVEDRTSTLLVGLKQIFSFDKAKRDEQFFLESNVYVYQKCIYPLLCSKII